MISLFKKRTICLRCGNKTIQSNSICIRCFQKAIDGSITKREKFNKLFNGIGNTQAQNDKEYCNHIWRYYGDEDMVFRKCTFCLLKQEMLGKWSNTKSIQQRWEERK